MSFSINTSTAAVTPITTLPGANGADNIVATPSGKVLYAADDSPFGIDAFSISNTGNLSVISGSPFPVPAFIVGGLAVDPAGKFLYAASPAFNVVAGFTINNTTGGLPPLAGPFRTGLSPEQVVVAPSGMFLYVTNQLSDDISGFTIDSSTGALTPISGSPFAALGSQPIALAVHPTGKFLFVALSNSNSVAAFSIDSVTGALTKVTGAPFATEPVQFTQINSITLTPSGKFLFAFNGIDHTISAFAIDSGTGALTPVPGSPFAPPPPPVPSKTDPGPGGPVVVDPSGNFLYVARSNPGLMVFSINGTTGVLTPAQGEPTSSFGTSTFPISNTVVALTAVRVP